MAEESARSTTILNPIIQTPQFNPPITIPTIHVIEARRTTLGTITTSTTTTITTTTLWLSSLPPPPVFPSGLDHWFSQNYVNPEIGPGLGRSIFTSSQFHQFTTALPSSNMSATALLQKVAQMGATMSSCASLQDVIMPPTYGNDAFGGMFRSIKDDTTTHVAPKTSRSRGSAGQNGEGNKTRDFLGLGPVSCDGILNIAGIESCIKEQKGQQKHYEQQNPEAMVG